jgi:hypothetical protein
MFASRSRLGLRGMGIAMAIALGGLPAGIVNGARRAVNFDPVPARRGKPFSSTRQAERGLRQGLHMKVVNGFPIMQTLPSKKRLPKGFEL